MVTILVFFRSKKKATLPRSNGYLLLSAFSYILPDVFHDDTNYAPSISPLLPQVFFDGGVAFQNLEQLLYCNFGDSYVSRLGFLDDNQAKKFCEVIQGAEINLKGARFDVVDFVDETRFGSFRNFNDVFQVTLPSMELHFSFLTPTAFKRQDKLYLLPDPSVLFSSILLKLQRLNCQIDTDILGALQGNFANILVSRCKITTDIMFLKSKTQNKGFVGDVTYDLSYCDAPTAKCATFLAEFARYSGVGIKTSQGMGSVWTNKK